MDHRPLNETILSLICKLHHSLWSLLSIDSSSSSSSSSALLSHMLAIFFQSVSTMVSVMSVEQLLKEIPLHSVTTIIRFSL